MDKYYARLNEVPSLDFTQAFSAGTHILNIRFLWDEANEEQYLIVKRALDDRALADPLVKDDGTIIKDYDWVEWYSSLPIDIEEALQNGMEYPQSLRYLDIHSRALALQQYKLEAEELKVLLEPYLNQLVWHCTIWEETQPTVIVTADMRPEGWIHDQDFGWRVRFASDLTQVGKNDLLNVRLEFEVDA